MDRKSKFLLGGIVFLVILSVASLFYRSVILQDFVIISESEAAE